ncbi:MAG: class I SAM-dependent methyltransferase [Saprospiraceae bacterium]|nr:class I SAM-dependent methyltransferase [Saprospiraceae bacterium]
MKADTIQKEWFASWFDSPFYHTLYKNRDEDEARSAIDGLLEALQLPLGARVLDLACGKGRHAMYLAEKGFDVTGVDISEASIRFARNFENENLSFYQHDMRLPFRIRYFDAVTNFFTSFGYFDNDGDHLRALKNVATGLRPNGRFLLDYFNATHVRNNLVMQEEKIVDGITFSIKRCLLEGYVIKTVEFSSGGRDYHFQEKVRLFALEDLENLCEKAGLTVNGRFGSYDLAPFDVAESQRLILVAEKSSVL